MTAAVNELGGWMAAPNYDEGSCCVYEGWRFGSVRRKTRRWRKAGSRDIGWKVERKKNFSKGGGWKQQSDGV
jgi:hypothetical protein